MTEPMHVRKYQNQMWICTAKNAYQQYSCSFKCENNNKDLLCMHPRSVDMQWLSCSACCNSKFRWIILKTDIRFLSFFNFEVEFRAILFLHLLNNTLHIIVFSSSMETFIFDGTNSICVEVNICKTTGAWKIDWIQLFVGLTYQYKTRRIGCFNRDILRKWYLIT